MHETGNVYFLIRKPEREKQYWRTGLGWEENFRVDVEGIDCACEIDLSPQVQVPTVTSLEEGNESPGSTQDGKFLYFLSDYHFFKGRKKSSARLPSEGK